MRTQQSSPPPAANVLTFSETLSWKAGRPIAIHTLIKRLKTLSEELQKLEQEDVDRQSLATAAKELCVPALLEHKDKGVKAYVACCLTDMLRLHAPDAPYTALQLRDIFELFVKQLRNLADLESPYYEQYYHLLNSLSQVQSIVLIADIPNSEGLILQLFTNLFDVGAKPEITKTVEYGMTDILRQVIDECHHLPSEVVDIVVAQFLRAIPSTTAKKIIGKKGEEGQTTITQHIIPPPAYSMAKDLCTNTSTVDKMSRHICQYFSEVILEATPSSRPQNRKSSLSPEGTPEPNAQHEPTDEDLAELRKAHMLVKELWRAAPTVLQNVVPQLEQELMTENMQLRLLAVETIGDMAASNLGSFSAACPVTWKVWCGRVIDKSYIVRVKWVEAAVRILQARSDNMGLSLIPHISEKLNDTDERVRLAACRVIGEELDYRSITSKLTAEYGGDKLLESLALRAKDKKHAVRQEGMKVLARMWDMGYEDIKRGLESVIKQLSWIPGSILETSYVNDRDVDVLMDHVVWEILIPLEYPLGSLDSTKTANGKDGANGKAASKSARLRDKERGKDKGKGKEDGADSQSENTQQMSALDYDRLRTTRILHLAHNLPPRSQKAFLALAARQLTYSAVLKQFVASASEYNSGTTNTITDAPAAGTTQAEHKIRLTKLINWLATHFSDTERARDHLWKWVKIGDRRGWNCVQNIMSLEEGWTSVVKSLNEVVKRIEGAPGNANIILETVRPLLYRSAVLLYNKSHVPTIVEFSKSAAHQPQQPDGDLAEDGFGFAGNELGITANWILKEMSSTLPAVFKAHIASLTTIIQDTAPPVPGSRKALAAAPNNTPVDANIVDTLSALSTFALRYPNDVPRDRKLHQALFSFATSHLSTPKAAKHAVRVLMAAAKDRREMYATDLIEKCVKELEWGSEGFVVRLGALAELVMKAPADLIDDVAEKIVTFCLQECLLQVRSAGGDEEKAAGSTSQWVEDEDISQEGYAKLLALKIMVNNLRQRTQNENIRDRAQPVFSILHALIHNKGEVTTTKNTPTTHRARLRLAAGQHILRLATYPIFEEMIPPKKFNGLALQAQDSVEQVRYGFIRRLKKYLAVGKLPPRYYAIVFLIAYEPKPQLLNETITWIKARAKAIAASGAAASTTTPSSKAPSANASGTNILELSLARLLSLIAHHPHFGKEASELLDLAAYIVFYVRTVVTRDNIGLVYHVAQKVKQVKDAINPAKTENLYYVSELAQLVLRKYGDMQGWGGVPTWPGSVGLPKALFESLRNSDERKESAKSWHLPPGVEEKLDGYIKPQRKNAATANPAAAKDGAKTANGLKITYHHSTGKKRKSMEQGSSSTNTPKHPSKKRRQKKAADDDDAEDGVVSSDGDEHDKAGKTPKKKKSAFKTPSEKKRKDVDGMSTVERRRSGRAIQKVVYAEDDEEAEATGEELEGDSESEDGSDSGSESGSDSEEEGSGDEQEEDGADDKMDIDEEENVAKSKGKGKAPAKKPPPPIKATRKPKPISRNEDTMNTDDDSELSPPPSTLSDHFPDIDLPTTTKTTTKKPAAKEKSPEPEEEVPEDEEEEEAVAEKSPPRQSRRASGRGTSAKATATTESPSVTKTLAIAKGKPKGRPKKKRGEDEEEEKAEETVASPEAPSPSPSAPPPPTGAKKKEVLVSPVAASRSTRGSARLAK
ncbi:hypothetical protein DFH27DRAFT_11876 [Peziza echinospora]|nr:hypothetical protein DFH27DRAFT_11876 [Peziza echinospora]